ncbi:MAG: response regulator transcription factor [Caldilineaceae bacterium]
MSMPTPPLRTLIIAGDTLARAGLAALLSNQPNLVVVGQVAVEGDLTLPANAYQPDIILWDLGWNPAPQLDALTALTESGLPVLALLPDAAYASQVWAAGARGLLLREAKANALTAALDGLGQGLVVFEPTFTNPAVLDPLTPANPLVEPLTPREVEVLQRMAEGLSNKLIARALAISEHTVKFHVNAILSKLGAQSRTEAVVRATRAGLILL